MHGQQNVIIIIIIIIIIIFFFAKVTNSKWAFLFIFKVRYKPVLYYGELCMSGEKFMLSGIN